MNMTESTLWDQWCDRRDGAAFERLVASYGTFAYDFARRVTGQTADAEDLMQEAFLALSKEPPEVPRAIGLRAFLGRRILLGARTLHRVTASRRRRDRRAARPESTSDRPDARTDAETALALLSDPLRAAATLRFLHGLSYAEVAATLNVSEAAARMRVHRALGELRRRLGPDAEAKLGALVLFVPAAGAAASIEQVAMMGGGLIGMKKALLAIALLVFLGATLVVQQTDEPNHRRAESDPARRTALAGASSPDAASRASTTDGPREDPSREEREGARSLSGTSEVDAGDPARVQGHVRMPNGDPVPDMQLHLRNAVGITLMPTPAKPPVIRTGAEGQFRFEYQPLRDLQSRSLGIGNKRTWISFATIAPQSRIDTAVDLTLLPGVVLEGIVLLDGQPIPEKQVQLKRRGVYEGGPEQGREGWTFTDADGRFRFAHLPRGDYQLTVRHTGCEIWAGTVEASDEAALVEIQLRHQRELEVRFENLPPEWRDAPIYLHVSDSEHLFVHSYRPRLVDGVARIPAPPPGRYRIMQIASLGSPLPAMESNVEIAPHTLEPVVFKLPSGAVLTGIVTKSDGTPYHGALELERGKLGFRTDKRGRFRVPSAPAGRTWVRLPLDLLRARLIEIDVPAGGAAHFDIRLPGGAGFTTEATSDRKLDFYIVELRRGDEVVGQGFSYDGKVRFEHLAPGRYELQVRANEATTRKITVDLAANEMRKLDPIVLTSLPRVPVKVSVPEGEKMPQFLYLTTTLAGKPKPVLLVISGTGDGHFSGLPPGRYTLHVREKNYKQRAIAVTVKAEGNETVRVPLVR
ncbi:MAG: sigma-70 family RNA polymerase sigma factor [Planctomycetota bacterium]